MRLFAVTVLLVGCGGDSDGGVDDTDDTDAASVGDACGDLPQFGWIYDFEMLLDGQSPTTYGWYNWTGSRGSGASCISLDNGVAQTYGADPRIEVRGGELNVRLRFLITTVGETDCPTTAASGAGPIELTGSFSASQIAAGEPLVLRTSPDAALQIRVTLTGRFLLDS